MKTLFKHTLPAAVLCALAACSEDNISNSFPGVDVNAGKELIELSKESGGTRATLTRAGFSTTAETKVLMRIKAEEVVSSSQAARWAEAVATASTEKQAAHDANNHSVVGTPHSDLTYAAGQERYWDDAFGRNSKLTIYAFAIPGKTNATLPTWSNAGWTKVDETTNPNWYKGDDYTQVSWTVSANQTTATMGDEDLTYSNNISESGTGGRYTHNYDPAYSDDNFPKTLLDETVMGNGQMRWWPKTIASAEEKSTNTFAATTGKFDQGHLIFKHAVSWIEINLIEGDGFSADVNTEDFKWTKNQASASQNITLKHFYTTRTLDVSNDTWSGTTSVDITQMVENNVSTTAGKTTRKLYAYVLPGNELKTGAEKDKNIIEFEIDNAKYYVRGEQVADAIRDYYGKTPGSNDQNASEYRQFDETKAGKHYVINLKVGKKGIERITAAIMPWESINSDEITAKNTYPTFTFEDRGTKLVGGDADEFQIYRAAKKAANYIDGQTAANYDWTVGYTEDTESVKASKTWQGKATNEWSTGWHWPDNLTYFHFRAVGIDSGDATSDPSVIKAATTAAASPTPANADYFNIASGPLSGDSYKDYTWGAPFKDITDAPSGKITYSTVSGFDNENNGNHQISNAIGATENLIQMLLFHMTCQIKVNVYTTTGPDEVTLRKNDGTLESDKTKVEILNFQPSGTVLMGNGLVTATGDRTTQFMTYGTWKQKEGETPAKVLGYGYGMIPQALSTGGQTVGLRITTPDGNQYVIRDISSLEATVTTDGGNGNTLNITNPYNPGSDTGKYIINRWYPNFKYTYNITLRKKGIERITAAVTGWEEVIGDNIDIDLEN